MAADGLKAIEAWRNNAYDLIFMDCNMPEMDGFQTARTIRHLERAESLPPSRIIALTASALQGDRDACLQSGMNDYLTKPIRLNELRAALERNFRGDPSLGGALGFGRGRLEGQALFA